MNDILKAREEKSRIIDKYLQKGNVISLKANIPGENKNIYYANFIIRYYDKQIEKVIPKIILKEVFNSSDGLYVLYLVDKDENYKDKLIALEEKDDFGRLIDLDFYTETKSLSRGYMRKCLLCEEKAFVCIRKQKHTKEEIIQAQEKIVLNKLKEELTELIKESMLKELNLHPKFGLVTPLSNGSHSDMNYNIMKSSIDVVIKGLLLMFEIGFNTKKIDNIYPQIKKIGLRTEKEMLNQTKGINTYQGLIFNLGIIISSVGYSFKTNITLDDIFLNSQKIAANVTKEYDNNSFGSKAYHELKFGGARKEASLGFPTVKKVYTYLKDKSIDDKSLIKALVIAILESEDTIFLKRAKSFTRYQEIKQMFKDYEYENKEALTEKMISENISFGGSADILICAIFIYKLNEIFILENTIK